jgi:RNA polymerase sigma-70 factor (ECF subfamily)
MPERNPLAESFESHRGRLRAVAYRMLGSLDEADDALQEGWLRLSRSEATAIENLGGWLTTVVARICLNMLEARKARRENSHDLRLPDPIVSLTDAVDPDPVDLVGEAVGLALLVVLDTLTPAQRIAFVLHDLFSVPFEEVARIVGRTPAAARQLASRARRRVRGASARPDVDLTRQREIVGAFLVAARNGDFASLLAVLDPDVVVRTDRGSVGLGAPPVVRGAPSAAEGAVLAARLVHGARPALVNGAAGVVSWGPDGVPFSVMGFSLRQGRIVAIDVLADPARLRRLGLRLKDQERGSQTGRTSTNP